MSLFKNVQTINQLHEQDPVKKIKSCSSWSIWEANVFFVNVNVSELLRKVLVVSTNQISRVVACSDRVRPS